LALLKFQGKWIGAAFTRPNHPAGASEIRFRATRRIGELMQAQKETVGLNVGSRLAGPSLTRQDDKPTLADAGIDKHLADGTCQFHLMTRSQAGGSGMKLTFQVFDGRRFNVVDVYDQDTNEIVGHIRSEGVGFGNYGGIEISLFDGKYRATLNRYEECRGFVRGVESVLNHMTWIKSPQQRTGESSAA